MNVAVDPGGETAWVAAGRRGAVYRVDVSTPGPRVDVYGTGGVIPTAVSAAPDGSVWVAGEGADTLLSLSSSGADRLRVDLGSTCDAPTDLVATDQQVWVACGGSRRLVALDPADGSVLGSYPVAGTPMAVCVDDAGELWVVLAESS